MRNHFIQVIFSWSVFNGRVDVIVGYFRRIDFNADGRECCEIIKGTPVLLQEQRVSMKALDRFALECLVCI